MPLISKPFLHLFYSKDLTYMTKNGTRKLADRDFTAKTTATKFLPSEGFEPKNLFYDNSIKIVL